MTRILVTWARPYQLSEEDAERWARAQAARIAALAGVDDARLSRLGCAHEGYARPGAWLLEPRLAARAAVHASAPDGPCTDWLADLRSLGVEPMVAVADRAIPLPTRPR